MKKPTFQEQQYQILKKIYDLTDGIGYREIDMNKVISESISSEQVTAIMMQLMNKGLANFPFGFVSITPDGIEFVEKIMAQTYAETELMVLKTIFEISENSLHKQAHYTDVQKAVGMSSDSFMEIIAELHDRKGYLGEAYDEYLKVTPKGKEFLQGKSNFDTGYNVTNYNIRGSVGAIQHQTQHSTQTVNQQINTVSNPEFNEAVESIINLVKESSLPRFQQEDLITDLERIKNLAENEPSPELVEHAKSKINYLETALKATDLATKVAPYFPQIYAFFEGLWK